MGDTLPGGNAGGAALVEGTVRRATGSWTPAVHDLLRYLETSGFAGTPRASGIDPAGREILSYLPGTTVGVARPWPAWVHTDDALVQVGRWLRSYHETVRDFRPAADAIWRTGRRPWRPGDVIGHNDAAPYNAVWQPTGGTDDDEAATLVGFFDWDLAAPCDPLWDLAFVAFSWVPLHARRVVAAEGFTDITGRPRRLQRFLDAYGYVGSTADLLDGVHDRITDHIADIRERVGGGDPLFRQMVVAQVVDGLQQALTELDRDRHLFIDGHCRRTDQR